VTRRRLALAFLPVVGCLGCSQAPAPRRLPVEATATRPAQPGADERVLVYFPPGTCRGELELERFDRASGAWLPHPESPRLRPGACVREPAGQLLNELRVRCVDASGRLAPSAWVVGAELGAAAPPCAAPGTP
jgi:hypothetical protein